MGRWPSLINRLEDNVQLSDDGCWIWTGYFFINNKTGYGQIYALGRRWKAHCLTWTLIRGEIPVGMDVYQSCGLPLCVNPEHCFLDNKRFTNYGNRHTNSTKELMSKSQLERWSLVTEDDSAARSRKISAALSGRTSKLKGVPRPEYVREKIGRVCQPGCDCERHNGSGSRKCSPGCDCARHDYVTHRESARKRLLNSNNKWKNLVSKLEIRVSEVLSGMQVDHVTSKRIGRYSVDIFIPSRSIVIEVMGCYWHSCLTCYPLTTGFNKHQTREMYRLLEIESKGIEVKEIWEHEIVYNFIKGADTELVIQALNRALNG